jgi:hypothetical protein
MPYLSLTSTNLHEHTAQDPARMLPQHRDLFRRLDIKRWLNKVAEVADSQQQHSK